MAEPLPENEQVCTVLSERTESLRDMFGIGQEDGRLINDGIDRLIGGNLPESRSFFTRLFGQDGNTLNLELMAYFLQMFHHRGYNAVAFDASKIPAVQQAVADLGEYTSILFTTSYAPWSTRLEAEEKGYQVEEEYYTYLYLIHPSYEMGIQRVEVDYRLIDALVKRARQINDQIRSGEIFWHQIEFGEIPWCFNQR
jgi:hypothetical protein